MQFYRDLSIKDGESRETFNIHVKREKRNNFSNRVLIFLWIITPNNFKVCFERR